MKKTIKTLLLAVLVVCTICVLTVMASATEGDATPTVVGEGYVQKYAKYVAADDPENVLNTGSLADKQNNLYWIVTSDGVLTITNKLDEEGEKASTSMKFLPAAKWDVPSLQAAIPWYGLRKQVTKLVIEAPITSICGYAFDFLEKCTTVVLPDYNKSEIIAFGDSMAFSNMYELTTLGRPGTPEGIIDLRFFSGTSSQCFEKSSVGKTITVLLPYYYDVAINDKKSLLMMLM